MFQVMGVFAEFERAMIVERVRSGMARAKEKGTKSGKSIGRPKLAEPSARRSGWPTRPVASVCEAWPGSSTSALRRCAVAWPDRRRALETS